MSHNIKLPLCYKVDHRVNLYIYEATQKSTHIYKKNTKIIAININTCYILTLHAKGNPNSQTSKNIKKKKGW